MPKNSLKQWKNSENIWIGNQVYKDKMMKMSFNWVSFYTFCFYKALKTHIINMSIHHVNI